jgi:hypothetical protein
MKYHKLSFEFKFSGNGVLIQCGSCNPKKLGLPSVDKHYLRFYKPGAEDQVIYLTNDEVAATMAALSVHTAKTTKRIP